MIKLLVSILGLGSIAEANPSCPSPHVTTYRSLGAVKLGSVPPQAAPDLEGLGDAFFVDVPLGSPNGSDSVHYKVTAIIVRANKSVVVVDDLARWTSVLPPEGHESPTSPAEKIRLDGATAYLEIRGLRESRVDVAHAKFLGCPRPRH